MKTKPAGQKLVFFGNERLATGTTTEAATLQALVRSGYEIAAVIAQAEPSQSRKNRSLEIAAVARSHKLPLDLSNSWPEIERLVRRERPLAAVLVAYGKLVPASLIDLFPAGIINIHPSLLPAYRGPTPIEQAILDGARQTGVSLMRLVKAMDAGPVYAQTPVPLSGRETKQALADKLLDVGAELLIQHLANILAGQLKPQPQIDSQASYTSLLTKSDGRLDWSKPAEQLEREVRAYADWPTSFTTLATQHVVIIEAAAKQEAELKPGQVVVGSDKTLHIGTSEGVLIIKRLKPAGRVEMSAAAFVDGLGGRAAL